MVLEFVIAAMALLAVCATVMICYACKKQAEEKNLRRVCESCECLQDNGEGLAKVLRAMNSGGWPKDESLMPDEYGL